jgi:predicted nucleotidyltransferase component of viral defense system
MLYILVMNKDIKSNQLHILQSLVDQIDDFYLVGGTALSLFYFDHRESEDLDFFTKSFAPARVAQVVNYLKSQLQAAVELKADNLSEINQIKVMVYNVQMKDRIIKIDFVEDVYDLINPFQRKNGINILSVEDIYLKKIYAVGGFVTGLDEVGQIKFQGGRQKAKDLFDLYYLSKEFLSLSKFVSRYCDQPRKEAVIRWFRKFDRVEMKMDLADIKTKEKVEFRDMDRHFKEEVDRILLEEIS